MDGILTEKQNRRRIFLYGLTALILFCAISLLQWVNASSADLYYYLAQFLALVLGIIHVLLLNKYLLRTDEQDLWKGLLATFLIMLTGAIAAGVVYHFLKLNYSFLTFVLPFIVPYICWKTYRYFLQIPYRNYKLWYYPLDTDMPDLDMIDLSQILVISFEFSKKKEDRNQTNFTSKAPVNMALGQLFFIFINDYNERNPLGPISYLGSQRRPDGWVFYRKKGWLKRKFYFDPDLTIRENAVRHNEIVFAQRVRTE